MQFIKKLPPLKRKERQQQPVARLGLPNSGGSQRQVGFSKHALFHSHASYNAPRGCFKDGEGTTIYCTPIAGQA